MLKSADGDNDTVADVLIKLIRVIANMSVNAEVGYGLGMRPPLGSVLLTLLLTMNKQKSHLVRFTQHLFDCKTVINFFFEKIHFSERRHGGAAYGHTRCHSQFILLSSK